MCFLLLCMLFTGILNYISAQQGITASCHQNLLGDSGRSGVISSPNFPFDYYGSQDCQYKIHFQHTAARDTRRLVCFVFRRFDLVGDSAGDIGQADEGHSSLCEDYLSINSIKYCGRYGYRNGTAPKDKGDCVFEDDYCFPAPHLSFELRFVSNDVSHASGFYAEYNVLHTIDTQALQDTDRLLPNTQPVTKLANHTGVAPCQEDEWTCFNRQCITRESLCDGMADCTDGSDESYTHARCTHRPQNIYGCTVEGQEEVMCGADVGVWMRGSGQLLPAMYDHTTGTSEGHFIFSSYTGDTPTRLTFTYDHPPTHTQFPTPANDVSPPRCVRFWYYMVGDVGDLYVGVVTNGASSSIVWSRSGDQGPMWHQGLVDIPPHYTHIQEILFITRRDITKTGFIAVDDISAVDGNCYGDDISCTFDIGSCQWRSYTVKAVAWTLNAGPTPSLDTGPFGDAHGGGQYMYLEASGNEGKVADLVSGVVSNWYGTRKCLIYSYHMFGEDLGELKVYIRHTDGSEALLLAHYGNKGHAWTKAMVSVSVTLPYQLVFRAVIGQGTKSDIAIDDVILQDGHCPSHTGGSFPSDGYEGGAVGGVSTEQTNHCKADEFMCGNGRCIPDYYHCDRRIDCFDKSDEENCSFDTSAAIVALCAVGVIMLIVIVIGAFLYSRKRQYDDDARRVSSVSEMMRDYRRRAQLEQDNRLEGRRHEYNELPPQISEPPPEYLSASTDQIGQAALGPQLTMDMRFPRDRDEAPPNYDAALDSIAYMPSTIGPNPPPYTNTLPDGGFPALDNDGFEQDEEEKKAKKLCKPNKEKLATLSGGERLVGSLPRFTISSGVAEGGEDRGHSSTYIPTHHRENTITAAALSPFRSLMRRNRLARSARERNVMAHALHMEHMSRAHGRPASYDQRRDVPAGAHQAAAFHSRAERGRTPEDYTDLFPDRAATFPRSQGIEALNTISAASLARDVGVPTDVSHTDASGDDAIASEAGEAAGGAGQVNLGATGDADDSALPCVPPRSSTYREWCDAHRDGADSTVGDLDGMVPCDQHGGANHGGGANIATVSSARPVAVAAPSTLATSTAERDRLMLDEPVALQRRSLYHDHTEPSRLDGYDNRY